METNNQDTATSSDEPIIPNEFNESKPDHIPPFEGEQKSNLLVLVVVGLVAILVVVGGVYYFMTQSNSPMMDEETSTADEMGEPQQLVLDTDLAPLEQGHYEGWLISGDKKTSTGKFNASDDMTFSLAADTDPSVAETFAVTIEPDGDTDTVPSGIVVLRGALTNGTASLTFPVDFSNVSGTAILATPTNGADSDETSGIWFLQVPGPEASLELPELPTGWVYEGWAVHNGMPLTSGRFASGDTADVFDGYSGPESGPAFPGEDYIVNAPDGTTFPIDMADGESKIVISVEPDIAGVDPTGAGPAQVKPLLVDVTLDQADHANITLQQNLDSIPSGSVTIN